MQSCCSLIACASTAAPRLHPLAAPRLRLLQLLLPSPIASASTAAPCLRPLPAAVPRLRPLQLLLVACVCFSCCSQSCLLQLLLPDCVCFNCCSPDCVRFNCCSLHPLAGFQPMPGTRPGPGPNVLEHSSRSSRFSKLKYEGRVSLV